MMPSMHVINTVNFKIINIDIRAKFTSTFRGFEV